MTSALPNYDEAAAQVAAYARKLSRLRPAQRGLSWPWRQAAFWPSRSWPTAISLPLPAPPATALLAAPLRPRHTSLLTIAGTTRAGEAPAGPLPPGAAWEIMTGAPVPAGADAVVMLEHVEAAEGKVRLLPPRTVEPGENIVAQGAQARAGDELLPAGTALDLRADCPGRGLRLRCSRCLRPAPRGHPDHRR